MIGSETSDIPLQVSLIPVMHILWKGVYFTVAKMKNKILSNN